MEDSDRASGFPIASSRVMATDSTSVIVLTIGRMYLQCRHVGDPRHVRTGGPSSVDRVFEAVLEAGEAESGVSIHLVDADYDTGAIVRQCRVPVFRGDSLDDLKARVRAREKEFVVETLGQIAKGEIRLVKGAG